MSREAFEAWIEATPVKERWGISYHCWAVWQAAQADAFERAAKVCLDQSRTLKYSKYVWHCADAIRALAKGAGNA